VRRFPRIVGKAALHRDLAAGRLGRIVKKPVKIGRRAIRGIRRQGR
jgi:hypothetical protein